MFVGFIGKYHQYHHNQRINWLDSEIDPNRLKVTGRSNVWNSFSSLFLVYSLVIRRTSTVGDGGVVHAVHAVHAVGVEFHSFIQCNNSEVLSRLVFTQMLIPALSLFLLLCGSAPYICFLSQHAFDITLCILHHNMAGWRQRFCASWAENVV